MKIHLIVFISQLKSITLKSNLYKRIFNVDSSSVSNNYESISTSSYEIERLLDKRITRKKSYYFVKWKKYDHQHNVWYAIDNLQNATNLIAKYEKQASRHKKHESAAIFVASSKQITHHTDSKVRLLKIKRIISSFKNINKQIVQIRVFSRQFSNISLQFSSVVLAKASTAIRRSVKLTQ